MHRWKAELIKSPIQIFIGSVAQNIQWTNSYMHSTPRQPHECSTRPQSSIIWSNVALWKPSSLWIFFFSYIYPHFHFSTNKRRWTRGGWSSLTCTCSTTILVTWSCPCGTTTPPEKTTWWAGRLSSWVRKGRRPEPRGRVPIPDPLSCCKVSERRSPLRAAVILLAKEIYCVLNDGIAAVPDAKIWPDKTKQPEIFTSACSGHLLWTHLNRAGGMASLKPS